MYIPTISPFIATSTLRKYAVKSQIGLHLGDRIAPWQSKASNGGCQLNKWRVDQQ